MGNLQERLSKEFLLGWLVCAIESEGSFQLAWSRRKGGYIQIVPRVNVGNLEQDYIEMVDTAVKELGSSCYISQSKRMWYATWYGMKRVLTLLDVIEPRLTIKKRRASILREFIEHRLSGAQNRPYGPYEKQLFLDMRELNGAGRLMTKDLKLAFERIPNDYTPNAAVAVMT